MSVRRSRVASIGAVVAFAAVGLLLISVGAAPAGNRTPIVALDDFPGPDEVTFGKNVAYTTSLQNTESSNYTHVFFRMPAPTTKVAGVTLYAQPVYASCEPTRTNFPVFGAGDVYECPEIATVRAGSSPVQVTLVWRTPAIDTTSLSCSNPSVTDCVLTVSGAAWAIKENQPGSNDTFPVPTDEPTEQTALLLQPDPKKSGGYALNTVSPANCNTTTANLVTNLSVGPANKIATAVCASSKPPPSNVLNPGLVIQIEEGSGTGITERSNICVPVPGQTCTTGYQPWPFSPRATFIFSIDNTTLPKGEKVDKVIHDVDTTDALPGVDVTGDCTINVVNKTKTTMVTCQSTFNGSWDFG